MGKTGSRSCMKIMSCAGDPAGNEDLEVVEEKASSRKCKWRFRKKSGNRQILSNNKVMEPLPVMVNDKEITESNNFYHESVDTAVPSKFPVVKFAEKTYAIPSAVSESDASDSFPMTDNNSESFVDESVVIAIQTAVRGYLARNRLKKLRSIVKLQAAVRGHLVRREAIGTLRCVQAIVKLQALVRVRHMRQNAGKGKESSVTKQHKTYSSSETSLTNGFARQLLKSKSCSRSKVIHISSDPLQSLSAWKWLERWMTVTSSDIPHELYLYTCTHEEEEEEEEEEEKDVKFDIDTALPEVHVAHISPPREEQIKGVDIDTAPFLPEVHVAGASIAEHYVSLGELEVPKCLNNNEYYLEEFQVPSSSPKDLNSHMKEKDDQEEVANDDIKKEPHSSQISVDPGTNMQSVPINGRDVFDIEKSRQTTKRMGELQGIESENLGSGLRISCNPTFAAVQSKFEELDSTPKPVRSLGSDQEIRDDHISDDLVQQRDSSTKNSHEMINIAPLDCGTEISISSTLYSPDSSGVEGGEIVLEFGPLEGRNSATYIGSVLMNSSNDSESIQKQKSKFDGGISGDNISSNVIFVNEEHMLGVLATSDCGVSEKNVSSVVGSLNAEKLSAEPATFDMSTKLEKTTGQERSRSSPEGSPKSYITATESYGTPSSQVSSNTKNSKTNKKLPTRKQRFQLAGKNSPANRNTEAAATSTPEHLPKDPKNDRRWNSLGTAKPEHSDPEPRVSSNNSLPNYMQATESARAKVHASSSPKASPDVHDKESYTRKRHSLPLTNGKQTSLPRMQRSMSQVQQNLKGNDTHSPHTSAERKWQR